MDTDLVDELWYGTEDERCSSLFEAEGTRAVLELRAPLPEAFSAIACRVPT